MNDNSIFGKKGFGYTLFHRAAHHLNRAAKREGEEMKALHLAASAAILIQAGVASAETTITQTDNHLVVTEVRTVNMWNMPPLVHEMKEIAAESALKRCPDGVQATGDGLYDFITKTSPPTVSSIYTGHFKCLPSLDSPESHGR
jgi:hypothetical protein